MEITNNEPVTITNADPVKQEAPAPAAAPETALEVVKPDSKALLDIAKREAEWAKREVTRKQETARLQSELKTLQEKLQEIDGIKQSYRADPEAALSKLGLTYEELTDAIIEYERNKAPPSEEDLIQQKVEKTIQEREEARKKQELEELAQQEAETVQLFQTQIDGFLEEKGSEYPLLTKLYGTIGGAENPRDIIYGAIEAHFDETGELLDFAQVAATAEEWFREEWDRINNVVAPKSTSPASPAPSKEETPTRPEPPKDWKPFSFDSVQTREYETPSSVQNKLTRPKARAPFDPKTEVRRDAVRKAVEILESYEKNR